MKKLSLCMIVKNEEHSLANALAGAKNYADEIIIVDTGSTDKTKEIAKKFTGKVYDFEWIDDFSKARNYAFDLATNDYLMWLDGDDIVPKSSQEEIVRWKDSGEECDIVMCPYVTNFDENFSPIFQFNRERIVKNTPENRFTGRVHEVIIPSGKIIQKNEIVVFHNGSGENHSARNLNIYQKMLARGETLSPREQFYYARELYFNGMTDSAIHELSKYLIEGKGWSENNIEACLTLSHCYKSNGDIANALSSLFGSLAYGVPKGEVLYEIGKTFLDEKNYSCAIYWLKLALESTPNIESGGFINEDCYSFLPAIALCVCYNRLGDNLNAYKYHEISKQLRPNDEYVKHNDEYFKNLLKT